MFLTNNATSKDPALYPIWEIFDTAWGVPDENAGDDTVGNGSSSSAANPLLALEDGEVDPDSDLIPTDESDEEDDVPTTQPEQTADGYENDELAPKELEPYLNDVSGDASESGIPPSQPSLFDLEEDSQSIDGKHLGNPIPMTREEFELTCETQPSEEDYAMGSFIDDKSAQPTPPDATGAEAPSSGTKDVDMMPPPLPPMHNKAQRRAAIEQRMEDLRRGITQTQVFFSKIPPQTVQRQVLCLFHSIIFHPITPCAIELQMIGRPWKKRGWLVGRALHHWMEPWIKPTNNKYIYIPYIF